MAEKIDDVEVVDEDASGGKSKKKIIIIAVAALALIGGGAAMFLGGGDEATDEESEEVEAVVKQAAIYFSIEKPLIVNFKQQSKDAVRYLSVKLKVMARDQATIDAFQLHTPAIQHELLMLLLGQKYDELNTTAGTKVLQQQTLTTINEVLKAEEHEGEIEAVYFTSLIMQ